jgi:hypothetical protein
LTDNVLFLWMDYSTLNPWSLWSLRKTHVNVGSIVDIALGMICHHPHEISEHLFFTLMLKSLNILGLYFAGKLADYEELVEGGKPDVSVEDANSVLNVEDDMDTQQSCHPATAAAVPTPSPAVCTSTAAIASTASSGAAIWGGEITVTSDRNALCHQA